MDPASRSGSHRHRAGSGAARSLPTALLSLAALLPALLLQAAIASAHGSLESPASRAYACRFLEPENEMCRRAWDANPQALYDWMEINLGDADGRHRELVPDGALCSAGRDKYAAFDTPSTAWPVTELLPDTDGLYTLTWRSWAPHSTDYFRLYLTREGHDPSAPFGWDDLDLVYDSGPWAAEETVVLRTPLPERTGRHLLYVVWQRDDSPEAFYSCSDVVFGEGTTGEAPPPAPPPADLQVDLVLQADWGTGYCADATVSTTSAQRVTWDVEFHLDDTVTTSWNAELVQTGSSVVARGLAWNDAVSASQPQSFGFCAERTGAPPAPPPAPSNLAPEASLAVAPTGGDAPLAVRFDAGASTDADGSLVTFTFDVDGDGVAEASSASPAIDHVFQAAGTFTAKVTVTDDDGASDMATATVVVTRAAPPPPPPTGDIDTPLATQGRHLVDADGDVVVLRGVNWFGFETANHLVHGLWTRDYDDMLSQIAELGYNAIRLPFSLQALDAQGPVSVNASNGMNAELVGKTPLEAMDVIIDAAGRHGLLVLLDNHSLADDSHGYGLWFGLGGYDESDWIERWQMLAERYRDRWNVVGADLKNEPHGEANWGLGGIHDWRLAAERAGNAVLAIAPHWLIVVEGVEGPAAGQQLAGHWWGGNLEGVATHPVRLSVPDRVVYSPHEYGPGVAPQPWFDPYDPAVLEERWQKGFHYIAEQEIAPILVGEFGGREVGTDTVEGRWQNQLVDFLAREGHSFAYWSWNPNSADTGGILQDDWRTVDAAKQAILDRLLGATPGPAPTPEPPPAPAPPPSPDVDLSLAVTSDWGSGYCSQVTLTTASTAPVDWSVTFPIDGTVRELWSATWSQSGAEVTAQGLDWNDTVASGAPARFGFCAER